MTIQIEKVARHRNGITALPFYVVTFKYAAAGDEPRPMIGILFQQTGACAVLDREQARVGNIEPFGGNCWRGDNFELELREAIVNYEQSRSSVRKA